MYFGDSFFIKDHEQRIAALEALGGISGELDLTTKLDKPSDITAGNLITYNPSTEQLEDLEVSPANFVAAVNGKGLSTNDFTDAHKDFIEQFPEDPSSLDPSNKMDKIEPTSGNTGKLLALGGDGNPAATGVSEAGVYRNFSLDVPEPGAYPTTYSTNTISTTGVSGTLFIATLLRSTDATYKRVVCGLIAFDGTANPQWTLLGEVSADNSFDGEIEFSITADTLVLGYTIADAGQDIPDKINLLIIPQ